MKLVKVDQHWPKDRLLINYAIHNVCNYKCWYCFPGSNTGNWQWPDIDVVTDNLLWLIDYYKKHLGKQKIQLNLLGGEPTLWPHLSDFVKRLKNRLGDNISIMITTNGSKSIEWWNCHGRNFDHVLISCHPKYANVGHVKEVADLLYTQNVHVDVSVLMDSENWDRAIDIVNQLKTSKCRWSIIASQVIHEKITYSPIQKKYLKNYLKRIPNLFWFWKVNKEYNYKVTLKFENGKTKQVKKKYILFHELNKFNGWECNIGIDNIVIQFTGEITAFCNETLYRRADKYNLYDYKFKEQFDPLLVPVICSKSCCNCEQEFNTTKRLIK